MRPLDERSYAFVVKIWEERRDITGAMPTWRGSVDDVQTGTRHYFETLGDLSNYLKGRSGMSHTPSLRERLLARIRHR
jgi:hypothetical protein